MNVSEIGEFGLIDLLAEVTGKSADNQKPSQRNLVLGIGDDTAAWQADDGIQLATTDTMVENVHFRLDLTSWEDLGWRALAANLSDIAAMGGLPRYALVSLSMPGATEVEDVISLYRGVTSLTSQSDTIVIGGNITGAPLLVITITVLGSTGGKDRQILKRSAAAPGDVIAVTGYLGTSAAGLALLQKGTTGNAELENQVKQAYLKPVPRIAEGQLLVDKGVQAAIDISDGLLADLGHICKSSGVGARIMADRIPVLPAVQTLFRGEALDLALSGGEDYELLFTAHEPVIHRVKETLSCPVTVIGEITGEHPGDVLLADENGKRIDPSATGWDHFSRESEHG